MVFSKIHITNPPIPIGVENVALFTDCNVHQICSPSGTEMTTESPSCCI